MSNAIEKIGEAGRKPTRALEELSKPTVLGQQMAYMGPNIGNLLNGSATPPSTSAVRA